MSIQNKKPSLPKGTRDFLPSETLKRNYLFDLIKSVFRKYGFAPIETPSMENLTTLTGKYGDEGDKLLFKVLNNGDFLYDVDDKILTQKDSEAILPQISKRGLRYDLTVPFARFVVMHQNEIQFPFKRYQIQPVWRADRPQKGRYQEFYQCDVDVVGSDSILYEAELLCIYREVFDLLGIEAVIKVNHRSILQGICESAGEKSRFAEITMSIDKLDKIGEAAVLNDLINRGLTEATGQKILDWIKISDLDKLYTLLQSNNKIEQGYSQLSTIFSFVNLSESQKIKINFDPTLARGLSYYTGMIVEVTALNSQYGSLGGGGRYANLTEMFGKSDLSGVGISFGAERIYDVMVEKDLFPHSLSNNFDGILLNCGDLTLCQIFSVAKNLRTMGLSIDVYPEICSLKKQLKYASKSGIKYAIIIGAEEWAKNNITIKNLELGIQKHLSLEQCTSINNINWSSGYE